MRKGDHDFNPRMFEADHIRAVLSDVDSTFPQYLTQMDHPTGEAAKRFTHAMADYHKEQQKYLDFLDANALEEYETDPGAFKGAIKKECPIIRRCLNSPAEVMDSYRTAFYSTSGEDMLSATSNIVAFAQSYNETFNQMEYMSATSPEALGLAEVDGEDYTTNGVIGGGIRSHFLYQLRARAFPNRSQSAIWAMYFLTMRKDYGFEDESEFLMVQDDGTQQNYFYPYELFSFYALQIFLMIERAMVGVGYKIAPSFRFVYVDTFLNHVSEAHENDIDTLRPPSLRFD